MRRVAVDQEQVGEEALFHHTHIHPHELAAPLRCRLECFGWGITEQVHEMLQIAGVRADWVPGKSVIAARNTRTPRLRNCLLRQELNL